MRKSPEISTLHFPDFLDFLYFLDSRDFPGEDLAYRLASAGGLERDLVARGKRACLNDREVKAAAAALPKASQDILSPKADAELKARIPRHSDLKQGRSDSEPIAGTDVSFQNALGRQVLAKHAEGQIGSA